MAENKTIPTNASVAAFLNGVENEQKRQDSFQILELMKQVTGLDAQMWGPSIIGFGSQHYKYESGREGDMPLLGFSPRKQNLTLYINTGFERYDTLLQKLGKHKTGKSCLYINKLKDVDQAVLKQMVEEAFEHLKRTGIA